MINIKDQKQRKLFDPWVFMSPKRRENLYNDWPGLFQNHLLQELPVSEFKAAFRKGMGRPTKELRTVLGALLLQQAMDFTDRDAADQLSYNIQWHYALNITEESDSAKSICEKTLFTKTTIKFLVNLKRQHQDHFDSIALELREQYLSKKGKASFSMVKPTESERTLKMASDHLFDLVEMFKDNPEVCGMHSYKLMQRVLDDQCRIDPAPDGKRQGHVKKPSEVPSDSLQNPSDPGPNGLRLVA